jgi:hypothetical protein
MLARNRKLRPPARLQWPDDEREMRTEKKVKEVTLWLLPKPQVVFIFGLAFKQ